MFRKGELPATRLTSIVDSQSCLLSATLHVGHGDTSSLGRCCSELYQEEGNQRNEPLRLPPRRTRQVAYTLSDLQDEPRLTSNNEAVTYLAGPQAEVTSSKC